MMPPASDDRKGMTLIVKTVTRITLGFILLYGVYITFNGHVAPGGGFVGGVIIALSLVHIMLAFGKEATLQKLHSRTLRFVISLGALAFLYIVLSKFWGWCTIRWCNLFTNEITIPFCEMVVVGGGLFAIFLALVLLSKTDRDSE
jgi:multisubunit Na+/H+ antiporter MnhB subunit